jgi:hypothetical protein
MLATYRQHVEVGRPPMVPKHAAECDMDRMYNRSISLSFVGLHLKIAMPTTNQQ